MKSTQELEDRIKELENELSLFQSLFENTPVAYQSLNEQGQFIDVNKAWLKETGYQKEEVIGHYFYEFIEGGNPEDFYKNFDQFKAQLEINDVDFNFVKKDGTIIHTVFNGRITLNPDKSFKQTHCLLHNISDKKKLENIFTGLDRQTVDVMSKALPSAVGMCREKKLVWMSERIEYIAGYTPEELQDETKLNQLFGGKEATKTIRENLLEQLCSQSIIAQLDAKIHTKEGRKLDTHIQAALTDPHNPDSGFMFTILDISDRKQMESKLLQSNQFIRQILDSLPHPFYIIDADTHILKLANKATYNYDLQENKQITCYQATHGSSVPCEGEHHQCPLEIVKQTKEPTRIQHLHKNIAGEERFVEIYSYPVLNEIGEVKEVIEYSLDITEKVEADHLLLVQKQLFEDIARCSGDWIWETEKDGRITYLWGDYENILGFTKEALIGSPIFDLISPENRESFQTAFNRAVDTKSEIGLHETKILNKDGRILNFRINSIPFWKDEEFIGYRGVFKDITQFKSAEDQLRQSQKMEALGTMAGGIAHDFNNVLFGMMGYIELAKQSLSEDSPIQRDLNQSLKAAERAKDLIQQILTFSRQKEFETQIVNIAPIIKESLKLIRASTPSTIFINHNISSQQAYILAEPTQIHQIIMNLCTNAIYSMKDTGGSLFLKLSQELFSKSNTTILPVEEGEYYILKISDTGCGIPEEIKKKVFDPFFTTKPQGEGTGLGLSVVLGIIKDIGGNLEIESTPGNGTIITIYLPVSEREAIENETSKTDDRLFTGTGKVMIVDDEEMLIALQTKIIKSLKYEPVPFTSPTLALKYFLENPDDIDMVITDQTMPKLTGTQFCKAIHEKRPDLPLVLSSGIRMELSEEDQKATGIRKLLRKPLGVKVLADVLHEFLGSNEKKE